MKKTVIASIIAIAATLTCLLGFGGCERKNRDRLTGISSGELSSSTGLERSWILDARNGKYAYLYLENKGSSPLVATINGQNEKTFAPGEKGEISLEVTQTIFGKEQSYAFKVVVGKNGGTANMYYEIGQRNELSPTN